MKKFCAVALLIALLLPCLALAEGSVLQSGAKGEAVVLLQEKLSGLGFLEDSVDGHFGKATERAVKEFQSFMAQIGHETGEDGVADERTLSLLGDEEIARRCATVRLGDRSRVVQKLQQRLIELGFLEGGADGQFGQTTQDALKAFQTLLSDSGVQGILSNGVADELTRQYLYSSLEGFKIPAPAFFDESDPLALEDFYLYSRACILADADTGRVLYEKNANERMYPASTTKIMTLLVALGRKKLTEKVKVPASADQVPSDSSRVPVTVGEKMPFVDLLYGLMLRSGNDAANAIAVLTSGSVDQFVNAMNQKAAELDMSDTHYVNPHGYHDANHYTTARDMATLTRYALTNPKFRTVISARSYTMSKTAKREELVLANQYDILNPNSASYYPGAFGIKTGYTSKAGQCYVGGAERNGRTLIAVVFDSGLAKSDKWTDARRLFNYGFAQ